MIFSALTTTTNLIRAVKNIGMMNKFTVESHCCNRVLSSATASTGRVYTISHEWITVNGEVGTVGITEYLEKLLGPLVAVRLPEPGETFKQGQECAILGSEKGALKIFCPVSGKIMEKNKEVESNPSIVNKSCYGEGWLFRINLANPEDLNRLMNEETYQKFSDIYFMY